MQKLTQQPFDVTCTPDVHVFVVEGWCPISTGGLACFIDTSGILLYWLYQSHVTRISDGG